MPNFELSDGGSAERVAVLLKLGADQAENTNVVMERIYEDMLRVEKLIFSSQGRRGGGSWKRLTEQTILKKGIGGNNILRTDLARPGYSKIDGSPSIDTLYNSLTRPDAPYQVKAITNDSLVFGTDRPEAEEINAVRPFMRFLPADQERWHKIIIDHVMAPFMKKEQNT